MCKLHMQYCKFDLTYPIQATHLIIDRRVIAQEMQTLLIRFLESLKLMIIPQKKDRMEMREGYSALS